MTRRCARRITLTSGARGWARVPSPDDYNPDDDPNGDPVMSGTKPVLAPAELARRCRALDARVEGPDSGPWKVFPPDGTSRPLVIPKRLRPGNEYPNIVAQLRRAGLDVYATDNDTPGEPAADTATPADVPPKLEGLPGGRPTLSYTLADAVTDAASNGDAPSGEQADYLIALLEDISGQLPALTKRIEKLEGSDRSMGRLDTAVGALSRRVAQAEANMGGGPEPLAELYDRVTAAETAAEAATTGLETANRITRELDGRLDTVENSVDALATELAAVGDTAPADEPQPEPEPARETPEARRARLTDAVLELLAATPRVIKVRRGNILDALNIDDPSEREDIRAHVLPTLVKSGRILRHGTGAGTAYSIAPEDT